VIPYHCKFGQHLCLVGSVEQLGHWDVARGLEMHWSDGDVWRVDVDIPNRWVGTVCALEALPVQSRPAAGPPRQCTCFLPGCAHSSQSRQRTSHAQASLAASACSAPPGSEAEVEYKYVVRNSDRSSASAWMPGHNCVIKLPPASNGAGLNGVRLYVCDTWDGTDRKVKVRRGGALGQPAWGEGRSLGALLLPAGLLKKQRWACRLP
jgi:hypothetical protein